MRQRLTLLPVFAVVAAFTACGSEKAKEFPLARIDGKVFTEADFTLRLSTLEAPQREAVLEDPERRRDEFNKLLRTRLFSLAGQDSRIGKDRDYKRRAVSISKRVLTQYYFDTHLTGRGGVTPAEIAAYYEENPSRFADDSGEIPPMNQIMGRIADSVIISKADLDAFVMERQEQYPDGRDTYERIAGDYIRIHKSRLQQEAVDNLKEKYGVRLVSQMRPPTEKELRGHYDANPENFTSPENFDLYHIEVEDKAILEKELATVESLEAFKATASRISENALTKDNGGRLGIVKRDFSLPYGIGTLPALFNALDAQDEGTMTAPIFSPSGRKWHAFWLVQKEPPQLKPFERVRTLVKLDFEENRVLEIQPRDTLAVIAEMDEVLREEDVLFLRMEIPEKSRDMYTRDNLLDYLVVWKIVSAEVKSLGLHREARARALLLQAEDSFWSRLYQDSILSRSYEVSPRTLKKTFKANKNLFVHEGVESDAEAHARDVAGYLLLTPFDFEIEYHTNPERYMRDTVQISFQEAQRAIFQNLRTTAYARLDSQVLDKLKKRFRVRILDESLNEPPLRSAEEAYEQAQELHFERRINESKELYERIRTTYPDRSGMQDSVSFGIAQLHVEQQRYQQALSEYRRVLHLRPESPNAYKAMFMIGFIQAEYLKRDAAAISTFETMLEKYPETDLSEDADWMIRNIRSGGQLMPTLEDDFDDWEDAEE